MELDPKMTQIMGLVDQRYKAAIIAVNGLIGRLKVTEETVSELEESLLEII